VRANGIGGVDMKRLEASIDQIAVTYDFKAKPKAEDIFTGEFLPPASERRL
jgi:NitT/TauT family transport system substrate-binding protein